MKLSALGLPLVVLLASCATTGSSTRSASAVAKESSTVGAPATDFTLRDLDGKTVRLSDYLGKEVVLINFWATWCVPCGAELPHLQALYEKYKDQGFVVLGVTMDGPETVAQVGPFARRYNLSFPVLLDEETRVVGVYNPKRVAPMNILIDRKGQVARVRNGYNAGDEDLIAADVASLLGN